MSSEFVYVLLIESFCKQRTLISIYNEVIRPRIEYCSDAWDVFGKNYTNNENEIELLELL